MSAIVELRDMADNILCDVAQSLDLCEIIQSDYDFINISNEKKIYIYSVWIFHFSIQHFRILIKTFD